MNDDLPLSDHGSAGALRQYSYFRPAILVLVKEREGHGYELAGRMTDLGFDRRAAASIYSVLRDMEKEQLITSSWDLSGRGGPPRRVYAITEAGEEFLREWLPALIRQRQALDALLDLYSQVEPAKDARPSRRRLSRPALAVRRRDAS